MDKFIKLLKKDPFEYANNLSVEELEKIINYTAEKYYTFEKPVISDAVYDMLIDFLKLKNPKSKVLKNIGSKNKKRKYIDLPYYLGSMEKIKPPSKKLKSWLDDNKAPFYLSDKLDGISALLVYFKDDSIKLYTRGNAEEGLDISNLLKYLEKIPTSDEIRKYLSKAKLKSSKNLIAFRGELILPQKTFNKNWNTKFKNARNAVSGLVVSKIPNPQLAKDTRFVIYEVVDPELEINKQYQVIRELKFNIVHHKVTKKTIDFQYLSEYFKKRRKEAKYEVDGVIVNNNKKNKRSNLTTKGNPKYAFAFKDILEDQMAETKVLEIEWKVSKDGYIKPVLILKPVEVGGVTIKRVTAINARYVVDNKLGKGAVIKLIRSGDVIPKIIDIIKPAKKAELPEGNWHWNETKVDIICDDCNMDSVRIKEIHYFFKTLETKGLGLKVVEKLFNNKLTTIEKILSASKKDFLNMEGVKEKSADNLKKALSGSLNNVTLIQIMSASNKFGHGLGKRKMGPILEKYPDLLTIYKKWDNDTFINNVKEIPGWDTKTAKQFVDSFPKFITFYNTIKKFIKFKKEIKVKKSKWNNVIVVSSGFKPNGDLAELLKKLGIKTGSSVSKNTDYLIVKDKDTIKENTGKVKKASDLNIKIVTKDKFVKLISN
jgi:DNA ligase (NAD+)